MEFRILGPLEVVTEDGRPVAIGGARERALLAALLASANQAVSSETLITDLWGENASAGSAHALRVHVSRLRKALRDAASQAGIETKGGGYVLHVDERNVDASRFEALVAQARRLAARGNDESAAALLGEALALWRGPALDDVVDAAGPGAEARRLEEAKLAALEARIEIELTRGKHDEVVSELARLTADQPYRERLWALRMTALYRAGRHAEAVQTYEQLRTVLRDDLGLEPSPELAQLHVAILRHEVERPPSEQEDETLEPITQYAVSGRFKIAYQAVGRGQTDVVLVPGFVSNVDLYWESAGWRRIFDSLTQFSRLILWDKRGTGLSDPVERVPTLDERSDDLLAVMEAAGSESATLIGISEGGPLSLLFAAARPERVRGLVLYGVTPRFVRTRDWQWGWSADVTREVLRDVDAHWGDGALFEMFAPTEVNNAAARRAWARTQRAGASPAMGRSVIEAMIATDCRDILAAVCVPTLVLHRRGDRVANIGAARYLTNAIPGARLVELEGDNHLLPAGDLEPILSEVKSFVAGQERARPATRVLVSVVCARIEAGSGENIGRARAMLHRAAALFGGSPTDAGDVVFVTFAAPSRALDCALAMREDVTDLGVRFGAGVHAGECDFGEPVGGTLVGRAAASLAREARGDVLTTATVRDLVAGSDMRFTSVRPHGREGVAAFEVTRDR